MGPARVSIVVPTYAGTRFLGPCLEALLDQSRPPDEILVVDDASPPPGDSEFLRSRFPDQPSLRLLRNPLNLGFAGAANRGLAAAGGSLIGLLNNDTQVERYWLERALEPFADPRVGAVATRLVRLDDPETLDSAGDCYTVAGGTWKFQSGRPVWNCGPARQTFSACAAAALYRREALQDAAQMLQFLPGPEAHPSHHEAQAEDGPAGSATRSEPGGGAPELATSNGGPILDPFFESHYEDVDLGFRIRLAGWQCHFVPGAICRHQVSASYGRESWRYHFRSARNSEIVYWSNMPAALLLRHGLAHAAFLMLQGLFKLGQGRLLPWLAGKGAAALACAHILRRRAAIQARARITPAGLALALRRDWLACYW